MSFRNIEQQQAAIAAASLENAKKTLVAFVYQKFPTIIQCKAAADMIVELTERWAGPDIVPTPEAFLSMLDENGKDALSMLPTRSVERTREQLVEEILSLLTSKDGGRDGKFDSFNLRSEAKRMESWSLEALRSRLNEIKTRQRMVAQPVAELKKIVTDARPDYNQWPRLPKTIVPHGSVTAVSLDARFIKNLDAYEIRRLQRLYGPQVDARLRGEN